MTNHLALLSFEIYRINTAFKGVKTNQLINQKLEARLSFENLASVERKNDISRGNKDSVYSRTPGGRQGQKKSNNIRANGLCAAFIRPRRPLTVAEISNTDGSFLAALLFLVVRKMQMCYFQFYFLALWRVFK